MGFMNYLNDIENNISGIDEDMDIVNDAEIIETETLFSKESKKVSRDSTVDLIENKLKDKLDDVGLNTTIINEIVDYVLGGVSSIKDYTPPKKKKKRLSKTTNKEIVAKSDDSVMSLAERAAIILDGVSDSDGSVPTHMNETTTPNNNISNVADHASSLL